MTLYENTMYQKDTRGSTRIWSIKVEKDGDFAIITKTHGLVDGKQASVQRKITKGKNIGKSNETTPCEQAILEAKSISKKKEDEGYSQNIEERGKVPVVLPMLAHDWNKVKTLPSLPLFVQPKIDGVRMIALRDSYDKINLTTRRGKPIVSMKHIQDELHRIIPKNTVLDGELFSNKKTFEEITGIVRRNTPKEKDDPTVIKYHIFDVFEMNKESMPFCERVKILNGLQKCLGKDSSIQIVDTRYITTIEEVDKVHERFTREGHEGTMYRTPSGPYTIRLRSRNLLKRKDFETDEYKIVGAEQADGKDKGTVIWICETNSGERFNVRPKGTLAVRAKLWQTRDSHIGKMLTVRFQNLSEFGVPRFPVGLAFRDYE